MGAVYLAFDERLQREVALKAIRWDRPDPDSRARFLREARILSQLRHPNVCTVHGILEHEGNDVLVLELVDGGDLRETMQAGADAASCWRIAEQLMSGLEVAHARGIVHRDLKPENLMVDAQGDLKILDFGLAQFEGLPPLERESGDHEAPPESPAAKSAPTESGSGSLPSWVHRESSWIQTRKGSVHGTAAFMSPEQARGEPTSPASDIYSAGLILHEVFTGKPPYPDLSFPKLLVEVAEGRTLPATGVDRDLARLIDGMKAPVPEDRPTAAEVGQRLRWIQGKASRRWRRGLAGAAVLAAVLGVAKYTVDLRRERNLALEAQAAEEVSRREAERVVDLLVQIFEGARPGDPEARDKTARELLEEGARRLGEDLEAEPLLRARLLSTLGEAQCRLGIYEEGERLLEEALEVRRRLIPDDDDAVSETLDYLGHCLWFQDRYDEAEPLLVEAVELAERVGEIEAQKSRNNLALVYWRQARYEEAAALHRRNLEVLEAQGAAGADLARTLNNLAQTEKELGRVSEAEALLRRAVELKEAELGPDHAELGSSLNNLASAIFEQDRFDEAEPLFRRALAIEERTYGVDHPRLSSTLNNLASLLDHAGRPDEAVPLYERARGIVATTYGDGHVRIGIIDNNLGELFARQGNHEAAKDAFLRSRRVMEAALGADHPHLAYPILGLAKVFAATGESEPARALLREALEIRRSRLGAEHPLTIELVDALAELEEQASP